MTRGTPDDVPPPQCPDGTHACHDGTGGATATWCELDDGRKHGPYVEWWSTGQMRVRGQYQSGARTGTWLTFSDSGQRLREIEFWEGDIHGRARFWYESGNLWKKGEYRRNLEHGTWTWYYDGGGPYCVGDYQEGKRHGVWQQFSSAGEVLSESQFQRGTGLEVIRYESGMIQAQIAYQGGQKHGAAHLWYESGGKAYEQFWNQGKPSGRWTTWNEAGEVVKVDDFTMPEEEAPQPTGERTRMYRRWASGGTKMKLPTQRLYNPDEATEIREAESKQAEAAAHRPYAEGEATAVTDGEPLEGERLQQFHRDRNGVLLRIDTFLDGQRIKATYYRDSEPYRIQRWHASGNLASEGELFELMRHGLWTHWHDNGQRSFMGSYDRGRPSGRFQRWSRNGLLLGEFDIQAGHGTWRDWYDNGLLREEGTLVHGLEHGPWSFYREDGTLERVIDFDNGDVTQVEGDDTILG